VLSAAGLAHARRVRFDELPHQHRRFDAHFGVKHVAIVHVRLNRFGDIARGNVRLDDEATSTLPQRFSSYCRKCRDQRGAQFVALDENGSAVFEPFDA
jgi:hypothetical protein